MRAAHAALEWLQRIGITSALGSLYVLLRDASDVEFYCSVKTDLLKDGAISRLFIAFASKRDSGNYTCSMRNAQASVVVHILDGKPKITIYYPKVHVISSAVCFDSRRMLADALAI